MTPITISVSEECIREGAPRLCARCPVALAMRNAELDNPCAGIYFLSWGPELKEGGRPHKMNVPKVVSQFMSDFDAGLQVFPFTFELRDESV